MTKLIQPTTSASELSNKAKADTTRYDPLEVGHALANDVLEQIWICIDKHRHIIDEPEFCVVMIIGDDSMLKNVRRKKFYAWPFLPKPRPNQSVFYYHKSSDTIQRLWVLPPAKTMALLASTLYVAPQWKTMQGWSKAFYDGTFHELIRKEAEITLLSETEFSAANRDKLADMNQNNSDSLFTETFDFSKVNRKKIINSV